MNTASLSDEQTRVLAKGRPGLRDTDAPGPVLRVLRHGDGGLALFNSSREESTTLIEQVLAPGGSPALLHVALLAGAALALVALGRPLGHGLLGDHFELTTSHMRQWINQYNYVLFGVDWIGMAGYWREVKVGQPPTFATTFGRTLSELRAISAKPILLSEVGAGTDEANSRARRRVA